MSIAGVIRPAVAVLKALYGGCTLIPTTLCGNCNCTEECFSWVVYGWWVISGS